MPDVYDDKTDALIKIARYARFLIDSNDAEVGEVPDVSYVTWVKLTLAVEAYEELCATPD